MNKQEFNKEIEKIINILDKNFPEQNFDISSKLYCADLLEDFKFIRKNIKNSELKILDLGCGKGHLSALLSIFLQNRIQAVDLLESFGEGGSFNVESLGERWQDTTWQDFQKNYRVDYEFYNGQTLPYPDQAFDVLIAYAVLEHVENENYFLQECARVLRNNGQLFIFRCPSRLSITENLTKVLKLPHHERLYDQKLLKNLFGQNGFEIKQIKRYDTFPAFIPLKNKQGFWNNLFPVNNILRNLFKISPFNIFAHHFKLLAIKK
ncbi:MAG: hypothetical protein A2Y82_02370 [Candidatus Buchananbacteria bacterium RBG_13_36_9]|uniref:Methyltransferase type 11 domain-containing protein n=1 Tax=Candidatus Buchananbacteria bacterium RBG_13_36_9 TaxID=1797530 RepID=A0A1G1XQ20_9BACT|nr:MAG: hypothetical protein A2Y82_02370 [Candidatus Buchananbacteria bacterium RBG_13_36_9]